MARNRRTSALFEIIRDPDESRRRGMKLPPTMVRDHAEPNGNGQPKSSRNGQGPTGPEPEAPAAPVAPPQPQPLEPEVISQGPPPPAEAPTTGQRAGRDSPGAMRRAVIWLTVPWSLRMPRGGWIGGLLGVLVLVFGGYQLGYFAGQASALAHQQDYQNLIRPLNELRKQPPEPGLIPSHVAGTGGGPQNTADSAVASGQDPREPGLNYFRLTTLPARSRDYARRAVQYLRDNGVDAALIPINNSESLKLVALRGFKRPHSDPAAEEYQHRLQTLGRKWKARHGGSSDWEDMFAEKYRPGAN